MAFVAQAILAFTGLSCEFPIQVTSLTRIVMKLGSGRRYFRFIVCLPWQQKVQHVAESQNEFHYKIKQIVFSGAHCSLL